MDMGKKKRQQDFLLPLSVVARTGLEPVTFGL